jgi:hypothetical protein
VDGGAATLPEVAVHRLPRERRHKPQGNNPHSITFLLVVALTVGWNASSGRASTTSTADELTRL